MIEQLSSTRYKTNYFNPKCENLSYTVGIIKPDTSLKDENIQKIVDVIESKGFIIKNMIQRKLVKEEVLNVFYKHHKKDYHDDICDYMLSGECCVILMCHETENPITFWKEIIGYKDPEQAKQKDPECLRAIYGQSLIKNELHGSDNEEESNRERDIFKFAIPQKIPEFKFDRMKISLQNLFKFLHPPNLEHPNMNERLDLFALYGPSVNYFSVDQNFCKECARIGKSLLEVVRAKKIAHEQTRLGIQPKVGGLQTKNFTMSTRRGGSQQDEKVKVAPIRLLKEEDIQQIYEQFCEKCKLYVDNYAHLCGGRDQQQLLTDQEINNMAQEINKQEILDLLTIEKGNAAKIMIEKIKIREPENLIYNKELITLLFKDLETDYYDRYDFYDMQQVILEDRRIRMNAWMSQLINKPINRFVNPKLIDPTITQKQRKDIKSVHFTLERTLPLSMTVQKEDIAHISTHMPSSFLDKKKLQDNEFSIALHQRLHRHTTHIANIDDVNQVEKFKISVNLLRDGYNEGRHGGWNNYCTLKGQNKGSFVKSRNTVLNSEFQ